VLNCFVKHHEVKILNKEYRRRLIKKTIKDKEKDKEKEESEKNRILEYYTSRSYYIFHKIVVSENSIPQSV
jgi:hypothetical protein